ncbi:MAG: signal peptidase I [Corynebacterium sp.]|nr:signal peptidase I [Corynebacterium sp.]
MNQQDSSDTNEEITTATDAAGKADKEAGETSDDQERNTDTKKKPSPWYIEIPVVVLITIIFMSLLQTFVGRLYLIPSQSMEPTLVGCSGCVGDRIVVEKITYLFSDPKPGDVIVFEGTPSWNAGFVSHRSNNPIMRGVENVTSWLGFTAPDENNLVKRVIATGGQTVQCLQGDPGVMVNGKKVDDSFTRQPPEHPVSDTANSSQACGGAFFGPITVPEGRLFMMGDNRTNSADSRYHLGDEYQGTIPLENVKGKVQWIILPFSRIGAVDDPNIQG